MKKLKPLDYYMLSFPLIFWLSIHFYSKFYKSKMEKHKKIEHNTEINFDSVKLSFNRGTIFINEEFRTRVTSFKNSNKNYKKVMKFSRKEIFLGVLKKMNNDTIFLIGKKDTLFLVLNEVTVNQENENN